MDSLVRVLSHCGQSSDVSGDSVSVCHYGQGSGVLLCFSQCVCVCVCVTVDSVVTFSGDSGSVSLWGG